MKSHLKTTKRMPICPTRELLDRVGDKWSMLLILTLAQAPQSKSRFSQLLKNVEGISQRMLTSTLRHLERDGFIKRYFYPEIPPRVEYELTPLGSDILSILQKLKSWVENNWQKIHTARVNFDSKHPKSKPSNNIHKNC